MRYAGIKELKQKTMDLLKEAEKGDIIIRPTASPPRSCTTSTRRTWPIISSRTIPRSGPGSRTLTPNI